MIGVLVNTATVLVGSSIGFLAKKIIPFSWTEYIMKMCIRDREWPMVHRGTVFQR